ncbi:hypothetical protein V6N11_047921 [Hibiscus sabdariffa]|uniref:RNase H type-1 domain-containing protein n=1 Tax=Hibiscus sabdariffa TaxID=183260 RepID=A0ABR2NXS1_9ROSI
MGLPVGYDTPMITAAEDVPIENAEGSKHHRVQTSPPEFSGSPDLNGALVQLSAGLVNQASLEIRFYHPVSITADMNKGLLATFTASEVYSALSNPAVAEARACEQAVALTSELGFRRAIVEGDAISVISKMTSTKSDRSHISPIIHNVQYLTSGFESLTFNFVRRSLNPVAHSLAQLGWSFPMCMVWIEEAPHEVDALLSSDRWWVDPPD